jgi:hypothetical protein
MREVDAVAPRHRAEGDAEQLERRQQRALRSVPAQAGVQPLDDDRAGLADERSGIAARRRDQDVRLRQRQRRSGAGERDRDQRRARVETRRRCGAVRRDAQVQ